MLADRQCPKCGAMMTLRLIEPARPGFDVHTFECPKCYETETFVVPISCEINVSIAPAVAGSRAASAFRPGDCSDDANSHAKK
jgi:DNA-directed RNA polymerase subunit M/transcription elongation factor TFIIS